MKQLTRKQRAKIYLEAAKKEKRKGEGIDFLYQIGEVAIYTPLFECFPELEIITGDVANIDNKERSQLRILALLFAHQIALNP